MTAEQAFNDQADAKMRSAKDTLVHYFGQLLPRVDAAEIETIVEDIVDAAVAATRAALIEAERVKR